MPLPGGRPGPSRFTLSFPGRHDCAVVVGSGAVAEAPDRLRPLSASRVAVITDSNLERTHGGTVLALLRSAGIAADLFSFPAGEASKTRATKERLEDRMIEGGFGRDSAVVAVGGGVTGDLAGFVAATYMRGVPIVQVPTSLLAMVDAAIGGKTAVDHPSGKNLIGAFHQPSAVLADPALLATLPVREYRNGLAEMVKAGVVGDEGLFEAMEIHAARLASIDLEILESLLPRAVAVKVAVVAADEKEGDRRKSLNFGHTVGHAIELESGYRVLHGEAVSIGMVAESAVAVHEGVLAADQARRIESLLRTLGLPVRLPPGIEPARLVEAFSTDKKSRGGRLEMALPARVGEIARSERGYARSVAPEAALACLEGLRDVP